MFVPPDRRIKLGALPTSTKGGDGASKKKKESKKTRMRSFGIDPDSILDKSDMRALQR